MSFASGLRLLNQWSRLKPGGSLPSGSVVGGLTSLSSAELYQPDTGTWSNTGPFIRPAARTQRHHFKTGTS